jgi:hypothetical protein
MDNPYPPDPDFEHVAAGTGLTGGWAALPLALAALVFAALLGHALHLF